MSWTVIVAALLEMAVIARQGGLMIHKQKTSAKALVVITALFFLLPRTANAEDYVVAFQSQASSPQEIVLPMQIQFAIKLRSIDHTQSREEYTRKPALESGELEIQPGTAQIPVSPVQVNHAFAKS